MTRFGMKDDEMKQIAKFIKRVVLDKENPEAMAQEVADFRKQFQTAQYCFKEA